MMTARASSGVVSGTWAITSPVMGERAASPCAASASSGTPSRLRIASASSRTADPRAAGAGILAASPEVAYVAADPPGASHLAPVKVGLGVSGSGGPGGIGALLRGLLGAAVGGGRARRRVQPRHAGIERGRGLPVGLRAAVEADILVRDRDAAGAQARNGLAVRSAKLGHAGRAGALVGALAARRRGAETLVRQAHLGGVQVRRPERG